MCIYNDVTSPLHVDRSTHVGGILSTHVGVYSRSGKPHHYILLCRLISFCPSLPMQNLGPANNEHDDSLKTNNVERYCPFSFTILSTAPSVSNCANNSTKQSSRSLQTYVDSIRGISNRESPELSICNNVFGIRDL